MNSAHSRTVTINRAPVLTLWGAVVAERLGFDHDEALTLGRAVADAHSKAISLGQFQPSTESEQLTADFLDSTVPVTRTPEGLRALSNNDQPIAPESVEHYLESKFGDALEAVRDAMMRLARSLPPEAIAKRACALYKLFRPEIPAGVPSWGAKGVLDLGLIARLAQRLNNSDHHRLLWSC